MNIGSDLTEGVLLCPDCGFSYLHLEYVMVHAQREDQAGVDIIVAVQTGEHRVVEEMAAKHGILAGIVPGALFGSGRRDHTILRFTCEGCEGIKEMRFEQHKGNTFAGWVSGA